MAAFYILAWAVSPTRGWSASGVRPKGGNIYRGNEVVVEQVGAAGTPEFLLFPKDKQSGTRLSYWHHFPTVVTGTEAEAAEAGTGGAGGSLDALLTGGFVVNMVCEIPRGTTAKMEVQKQWSAGGDGGETGNPIAQDRKKGKLRHYPWASLVNYGAVPRTYEHPSGTRPTAAAAAAAAADAGHAAPAAPFVGLVDPLTHRAGDGDPVDVIDLFPTPCTPGEIYPVRVVGALAMVDGAATPVDATAGDARQEAPPAPGGADGVTATDWKIVAVRTTDRDLSAALLAALPDLRALIPTITLADKRGGSAKARTNAVHVPSLVSAVLQAAAGSGVSAQTLTAESGFSATEWTALLAGAQQYADATGPGAEGTSVAEEVAALHVVADAISRAIGAAGAAAAGADGDAGSAADTGSKSRLSVAAAGKVQAAEAAKAVIAVRNSLRSRLAAIRQWFRDYKKADGQYNVFDFQGSFLDARTAAATLLHSHATWCAAVHQAAFGPLAATVVEDAGLTAAPPALQPQLVEFHYGARALAIVSAGAKEGDKVPSPSFGLTQAQARDLAATCAAGEAAAAQGGGSDGWSGVERSQFARAVVQPVLRDIAVTPELSSWLTTALAR